LNIDQQLSQVVLTDVTEFNCALVKIIVAIDLCDYSSILALQCQLGVATD
jgi:hypothetical protein